MNRIDQALWYVESRQATSMTLDDIAAYVGVSKYYLLRAFAAATGQSLMRYVRARRLTEGARRLAAGAADILDVALTCGYSSHEAFTRAFRERFGKTPEEVRAQAHVRDLDLRDAIPTGQLQFVPIAPPRFENGPLLLLAGLNRYYSGIEAGAGVPAQWEAFAAFPGTVKGRVGLARYGACYAVDDEGSMDYLSAVRVQSFIDLPPEFSRLRLPARRYAVFTHSDHVASIRSTWNTVWNDWLPRSGCEAADAPLFERYDAHFDWRTGTGGLELWLPLE